MAHGDVVGRSEAEVGEQWMVMGVRYTDRYVRVGRRLVFALARLAAAVRVRCAGPAVSATDALTREQRLERLDAYAQIRDLALRYAAAMVDPRPGDARAAVRRRRARRRRRTGRDALREAYFGAALDRLSISVLHPGTHVIDLDPERPDRARGSVYTLAQIKDGGRWMRQAICYFDRYAKRDGRGCSSRRDHQLFYGADYDQRPNHLPPANWPESDTGTGTLPFGWPTWPPAAARAGG